MRPFGSVRSSQRLSVLAIIVGLIAPLVVPIGPSVASAASPPPFPTTGTDVLARGSWLVMLAPGTQPRTDAPGLARAAGGSVGQVYDHAIKGFQLKGSAAAASALRRNPNVISVTPDHAVYLSETLPYGISRVGAFILGGGDAYSAGYRGAGARIAVIDTGIDLDHPDLAQGIDQASGYNCVTPGTPPDDGHGHGTHVSGTAAAPLNGVGVVGVAPEATLVPFKSFDDVGNSSEALVLCGLDHVVALNTDGNTANDIDVVSMSWGDPRSWGSCADDALHAAICAVDATGAVLVGGAGNNASDAGTFVPAAFPEVLSVSALSDFDGKPGGLAGCALVPSLMWYECDDTMAFFSNYGPSVDLIAPGVNVYSTWAGGGYNTIDGTSMATPHVSGVVALMKAANPGITPAEVRADLLASGECPNGQAADADGTPGCAGQGTWPDDPDGIPEVLPNALRAAQLAAGGTPPPPPPTPTPTPTPTPVIQVPSAPTLLGGAAAGAVALSWTTPTDDGGSPITGYRVYRSVDGDPEILLDTTGATETAYADLGLTNGTPYTYRVTALNAAGEGSSSNTVTVTPGAAVAPSAPLNLAASKAHGNVSAIDLTWDPPADDGGSPIAAYFVYRQAPGESGFSFLATSADGSTTSLTDSSVERRTVYSYYVVAWNGIGPGPASNTVSIRSK